MGNTMIYYKKALQLFAYTLNVSSDKPKAKIMREENSFEILEDEIKSWKKKISLKEFYFNAGRAFDFVLNDCEENDGCDGLNACIGGLNQFMSFIELNDDDRFIRPEKPFMVEDHYNFILDNEYENVGYEKRVNWFSTEEEAKAFINEHKYYENYIVDNFIEIKTIRNVE